MEEARQHSAVTWGIEFALPIVLLLVAVAFGWQAVRGLTKGITNFPIQLIGTDEFRRGNTMFWGVVGANVIACFGLFFLSALAFLRVWQ